MINGNRYWLAMFFFAGILWLAKRGAFVNLLLAVYPQKRGFAKVPVLWSCFHISWIKVHMLEGKANKIQDRLIQEAPPQKKVNAVVAWWFYWISSRNKGFRPWWASKMCAMPTLIFFQGGNSRRITKLLDLAYKPATTPMGGWEDQIAG